MEEKYTKSMTFSFQNREIKSRVYAESFFGFAGDFNSRDALLVQKIPRSQILTIAHNDITVPLRTVL